jgi:hypothetical protein
LSKSIKGLVIFTVFCLNTFVVYKYMDGTFPLPSWAQQLITYFDVEVPRFISHEDKAEDLDTSVNVPTIISNRIPSSNKVINREANVTSLRYSEFPSVGVSCSKGRFGAKQKDKPFYVWTDYKGQKHISDKPPKLDNTSPVSILGTYPKAQFITRFMGKPMSVGFQDELNQRLARLTKEYAQVLDVTTVREVRLNFRFFKQQAEFDRYKKRVAPKAPSRTGFYRHAANEMVILVTDEVKGLDTSIHETVHAINRALFGSMAKWLNEGLAQALTVNTSNTSNTVAKAPRIKYSMSKGKLFKATDEDWAGPLRNQLYLSSKAFIHQLMATERGRNSIARLLLAEQVNGCNDLTSGDVSRILG